MDGYMLTPLSIEEKRELLEKAVQKSVENGTWPILLAFIGSILNLNNLENE